MFTGGSRTSCSRACTSNRQLRDSILNCLRTTSWQPPAAPRLHVHLLSYIQPANPELHVHIQPSGSTRQFQDFMFTYLQMSDRQLHDSIFTCLHTTKWQPPAAQLHDFMFTCLHRSNRRDPGLHVHVLANIRPAAKDPIFKCSDATNRQHPHSSTTSCLLDCIYPTGRSRTSCARTCKYPTRPSARSPAGRGVRCRRRAGNCTLALKLLLRWTPGTPLPPALAPPRAVYRVTD